MNAIRRVLLLGTTLLFACRDGSGPTGPHAVPIITGTWTGTLLRENKPTCPVTVEIAQPDGGSSVTGSIQPRNCGPFVSAIAIEYARLVEGLPWKIDGSLRYNSVWGYPYGTWSATMSGSLEGSPVSRISAITSDFKLHSRSVHTRVRLEIAKKSP